MGHFRQTGPSHSICTKSWQKGPGCIHLPRPLYWAAAIFSHNIQRVLVQANCWTHLGVYVLKSILNIYELLLNNDLVDKWRHEVHMSKIPRYEAIPEEYRHHYEIITEVRVYGMAAGFEFALPHSMCRIPCNELKRILCLWIFWKLIYKPSTPMNKKTKDTETKKLVLH